MFLACSIAKVDITSAARAWGLFLIMFFLGLLITVLFPSITLFLPGVVGLIN